MRRMFIAVTVTPEPELIALRAGAMRHFAGEDFRWVRPEQFHITLKFLGEVPEAILEPLCDTLSQKLLNHTAFTFPLQGFGLFGSRYDPRVLWVGATRSADLVNLGEAVLDAAATMGFPRERIPFVPHLTMARIAKVRDKSRLSQWVANHRNLWIQSCMISEVTLFESVLKTDGALHLSHQTFTLPRASTS